MSNLLIRHYLSNLKKQEALLDEENKRHEASVREINANIDKAKKKLYVALKRMDLLEGCVDKVNDMLFTDR